MNMLIKVVCTLRMLQVHLINLKTEEEEERFDPMGSSSNPFFVQHLDFIWMCAP